MNAITHNLKTDGKVRVYLKGDYKLKVVRPTRRYWYFVEIYKYKELEEYERPKVIIFDNPIFFTIRAAKEWGLKAIERLSAN